MNSKKAVALRWIWPLIVSAAASNCLDDQSPLPTRVLLQSQSELTKAENSTGTPFMVLDVWDETHPTHSTFVEHFFGAIGLLLTVSLAIYLKFIVEDYEEKTSANSPPWFCDERIIVQVGGGFVLAWVVIGVMVFTQVLSFSVLGKERNLTALVSHFQSVNISRKPSTFVPRFSPRWAMATSRQAAMHRRPFVRCIPSWAAASLLWFSPYSSTTTWALSVTLCHLPTLQWLQQQHTAGPDTRVRCRLCDL